MMQKEKNSSEEQARELLSRLNSYAREHSLSKKELSERINVIYSTLNKWWFFTEGKSARKPSDTHIIKIQEFLLSKESPEVYAKIEEARHRTEKIKYLLLLLEDELRWFKGNDSRVRDEFRKGLDAPDIGYISSLLIMLTEEDKFARWLALTTIQFNSFKRR